MHIPFAEVIGQGESWYLSGEGRWFLLALLGLLGATFGSFMNVVVHRLPLGLSLSHPASRCPVCEHPIRWHDNVPIFGWLRLRGRCRDCRAAISARYPLVEALVAAVSVLIAWTEGMPEMPAFFPEDGDTFALQLGLYAFHLLLMCTLICAALIEFDGHLLPKRIWISVLIVGLVVPVFRPDLRPISSVFLYVEALGAAPQARGLADGIAGFMAAWAIGVVPWITWFSTARRAKLAYASTALAALLLVGTFLGDEAVIVIGLGSMVLYFVTRLLAQKWPMAVLFGWAGPLALATLIWILSWPAAPFVALGIGPDHQILAVIGAGLTMAVLAIILQFVPLPQSDRQP